DLDRHDLRMGRADGDRADGRQHGRGGKAPPTRRARAPLGPRTPALPVARHYSPVRSSPRTTYPARVDAAAIILPSCVEGFRCKESNRFRPVRTTYCAESCSRVAAGKSRAALCPLRRCCRDYISTTVADRTSSSLALLALNA